MNHERCEQVRVHVSQYACNVILIYIYDLSGWPAMPFWSPLCKYSVILLVPTDSTIAPRAGLFV